MKRRLFLFIALSAVIALSAEVHIQVDDPETWSGEKLRPYIGQTVIFDVPMIVCSNSNNNYVVSPWRRFQPENQGTIGSDEYNETVRVNSSCMFSISNVPSPTTAMGEPMHRCGEKIIGLKATVNSTSSLTFKDGKWKGNTRADLEKSLPHLGDYRLLVCGFNLENYFMTWGSMGADSYAEHQKQRAKISKALAKINADIYGLVELQQGNEAIGEIVSDLKKNHPGRNYKYFSKPSAGTMQKVDFVYDANKVYPIGIPVETTVETSDRKKMVCFREKETGEKFIYSINHFKAMNSGDESRRVNEAKAVVDLYNSYRQNRNIRDDDVLIMGDLNCYAMTAPIQVFKDRGLIDMHRAFHADSSYSYMFSNLTSYIDHAICNNTIFRQITGMAAYHINSDEDDKYNYQRSSDNTMFRCSDHDPVLVGLKLDSTITGDPYFNNGNFGMDSVSFYYSYVPGEENNNPLVYFDIYTVSGYKVCGPTPIQFNGINTEDHHKYYTFSQDNPDLPQEIKDFLPLPAGVYVIHLYYSDVVKSHKLIVQ